MSDPSAKKAVQARRRIRTADRSSQFWSLLPCSPTITDLPAPFQVANRFQVLASELDSDSRSYQWGALTSITGRSGRSKLVAIGWWYGSMLRRSFAICVYQAVLARASFRSSQKST